ncbi:MAG TPA: acyltransferase family protein [Kofleriaceae bacterium]
MQYRREVDGLRAVAVLAVILFHAGLKTFSGGFVGVDVFFVISGYLITTIIVADRERGSFSLLRFYERRARRILPALFVVMAVCIPVAWLLLLPQDLKLFGRSVTAVSMFASNVLFWLESGYFDVDAGLKPLLHTWSLGVEEQFYVVFPLLVILVWRLGKRWLTAVLVIIACVSLTAAHHGATTHAAATFFLLPTRGWELLIGAVLSLYVSARGMPSRRQEVANAASVVGLLAIVYSVVRFDAATPFPSLYALVPTLGAALILLFATPDTLVGRVLASKPLVGVGLISYSAYLWHQPLVVFARHVVIGGTSQPVQTALSLSALPLAYVTWRFVEQPFRKSGRFGRNTIFALAIAGSMAFFAIGIVTMRAGARGAPVINDGGYASCAAARAEHRLCVLGNATAPKTIVLVGDSHAHHLLSTLVATLGGDYKIVPFICNSCFFGDRVRFDREAEFPAELARTRDAIQLLAGQPIAAVIRAQRWHGYGIDTDEEVGAAASDATAFFGIPYEKLIVVGSTANVDFRCLAARALGKFRIGTCSEDSTSRKQNETFVRATKATPMPANVYFVYPFEIVEGQTVYYRDDHHLSEAGAKLVVDEIARIIAR